jgi:hypothetical protein
VCRKLTGHWIQILPDDVTPELATVVQRISGLPIAERMKQGKTWVRSWSLPMPSWQPSPGRATQADRLLSSAEPVRVPIAARILLVSDKTVRAWAEDGLLTSRAVRPRRLLDAERLHTVLRFLDDLRAAGQDRDFRDNLWIRLQDEALLDRADLAESLAQMNAGNMRPALTSDEELKERRNRR